MVVSDSAEAERDLLVDGLEKLALVFPHLGVIDLLDQLGVFVDEPCFPEYIGSCVLHLWDEVERDVWACFHLLKSVTRRRRKRRPRDSLLRHSSVPGEIR